MDNDTEDESNNIGSSSILRVAGFAHYNKYPRTFSQENLAVKIKIILSRKKSFARATIELYYAPRENIEIDERIWIPRARYDDSESEQTGPETSR